MIIDTSIKVANYKCFGEEPQGFEKIYPINIIIGKNNVGKSSLIDLIEYSAKPFDSFYNNQYHKKNVKVFISKILRQEDLFNSKISSAITNLNHTMFNAHLEKYTHLVNKYIIDRYLSVIYNSSKTKSINIEEKEIENSIFRDIIFSLYNTILEGKIPKRINSERDIVAETMHDIESIDSNGNGATAEIWRHLSLKNHNHSIIKKDLIENLNLIVKPEIEFKDIIIKENHINNSSDSRNVKGEIYFEDKYGAWVALSKMGSGIKTILLILLNLLIIPAMRFNNRYANLIDYKEYIFCFEELENNLHPSLQRRLFNFIAKFSQKNQVYFFITTHSHIVIDMFSNNPNAQILHVRREGEYSVVDTVVSDDDSRKVLKDLDYRASDLLLSNGIIWVEGPSDVIYLELFLDLYKQSLKESASTEKLSYSIQALATAVWKYAGFEGLDWEAITNESELQSKIIALEKLNHNHLLIIDNDGNYEDLKPSEYDTFANGTGKNKAILINNSMQFAKHDEAQLANNFGDTKSDTLFFWINEGTMETYLQYFIDNKGKVEFAKYFDKNEKKGHLEKKRNDDNYSKSKVVLASEIAGFCIKGELKLEDIAPLGSELHNKIKRLYNTIKSWN